MYDPVFYRSVPERGISSAIKYFALLSVLVSLVLGIALSTRIGWYLAHDNKVSQFRGQVESIFPDKLVLKFGNGEVSSNVEEPYAISLPEAWKDNSTNKPSKSPKNLLIINTTKPIELTDFATYDTAAILGKDQFGFYNPDQQKLEIRSIGKLDKENVTIDKSQYVRFIGTLAHYVKLVVVTFLCLSPLFVFLLIFLAYLLYLIFGTLAVWLGASIKGVRLTYSQAYACALYMITLPLVYKLLVTFFAPDLSFAFDMTLMLFALALLNFSVASPEAIASQPEGIVVQEKVAPTIENGQTAEKTEGE